MNINSDGGLGTGGSADGGAMGDAGVGEEDTRGERLKIELTGFNSQASRVILEQPEVLAKKHLTFPKMRKLMLIEPCSTSFTRIVLKVRSESTGCLVDC